MTDYDNPDGLSMLERMAKALDDLKRRGAQTLGDWLEGLAERLAWWLPRRLVYWATIRLWAEATTGRYANTHPMALGIVDVLDAWTAKQAPEEDAPEA